MMDIVERLREKLGSVETPMMQGDNLAITLCNVFENPDQEADGETSWTPDAEAGYKEVCDAIHAHYAPTIQSLQADNAALREGLRLNQAMLETISRTNSTDFKEVRERIMANRALIGKEQS